MPDECRVMTVTSVQLSAGVFLFIALFIISFWRSWKNSKNCSSPLDPDPRFRFAIINLGATLLYAVALMIVVGLAVWVRLRGAVH